MTLDHLDMAIAFAVVMLTVSLLVTIFVQTASAVLGLRGTNLRWGIDQVLRMVHPELGDRAAALTDRVLQHPIISDSAMSRFAGARQIPVIGRWFARLHYASAIRVEELIGVMDVLAGRTTAPDTLAQAATDEQRMAYIVAAARNVPPRVEAMAVQAVGPHDRLAIQSTTSGEPRPIARWDLPGWFDATMDRVSQRFVTYMRLWTVAFSIVVAFGLHLDTFHLLSQLATSADARARLAGVSDTIQRVADETANAGANGRDAEVRRLSDQATTLRGLAGDAGFQLVPDPYHSWDFSPWWPTPVWAGVSLATVGNLGRAALFVRPSNLHFWGILFSAGLLSLGAPFWYNTLKSLSALKPIVANKEDRERQGADAAQQG